MHIVNTLRKVARHAFEMYVVVVVMAVSAFARGTTQGVMCRFGIVGHFMDNAFFYKSFERAIHCYAVYGSVHGTFDVRLRKRVGFVQK